jgi:hypothetical protein
MKTLKYLLISILIILLLFYFYKNKITISKTIDEPIAKLTTETTTKPIVIEKEIIIKPVTEKKKIKVEEKITTTSEKNVAVENKLPKSILDVNITPKLKEFFNKYWDGSTEKINFKLKLFDKLEECLGPKAPTSGDILMNLLVKSDIEYKIAMGIEARDDSPTDQQSAFQIRRSSLSSQDEEIFELCIREAHIGLVMSIADELKKRNGTIPEYYHIPMSIHFPLKDDIIYWLLAHEGEPPPGTNP